MKLLLLACAVLVAAVSAPASLLLTESFDYPDGVLTNVSGGTWEAFSGTSGSVLATNGRAALNLANAEDVQRFLAPPPGTDVLYAGFTLRFTTLPPGGGSYFALFSNGGTSGFRGRVWALTGGAAPGKFRLGLSSVTAILNVTNAADLSTNVDYWVVVRVANATGATTLWINPAAETDPAVTTSEAPASGTLSAFALRQGGGPGQLTLDDLVVGEAFAEVLSTNPPPAAPAPPAALSVLTYNTKGNSVADWSTNSAQVQAIGRQVAYLDPDLITFQEIPMTNSGWAKLPDFVAAYRPGYYLATNSATDGFIRSAILSRYPITRSQSWLHSADLKPFGYTNTSTSLADNFTRDLFEAEIAVPNFAPPVHLFTTHLKSGSAADDYAKRAAEAAAISNFFATVFLPAHGDRPYLLTGDLNEDIAQPGGSSQQPLQRLVNEGTGLRLTVPRHPVTLDARTFSIQSASLSTRFDYILPGGLLFSNLAGAEVFRTDLLTNWPPTLLSNDCRTASDHLPVLMRFANPYNPPFRLLAVAVAAGQVTVRWESASNRLYHVETSPNLAAWSVLASNLPATGTNTTFTTNAAAESQFFRVYRVP